MELERLKSAWKQVSEKSIDSHRLEEDQIREMLKHKGTGIINRINRNVKIGFGLLALFIFLMFFDLLFPKVFEEMPTPPSWLLLTSQVVDILIILSFVTFAWRHYQLKIDRVASEDLPLALSKLLTLLNTFQKQFYLAMTLFIVESGISFSVGMYYGFTSTGAPSYASTGTIILSILILLAILAAFITLLIFVFRKGFNALYGKYYFQLQQTIKELNELEN